MIRQEKPLAVVLAAAYLLAPATAWGSNEISFEVKRTASRTAAPSATAEVQVAPAPPAGWEVPPPAETKKSTGKNGAPACCGFDQLCCTRQADIDRGIRKPATRNFYVRFTDVPEAIIKEATKEGPPLEGVPEVRVVDGTGAPFPWRDGPKQFEIRVIPPGMLGYIRFGNNSSGKMYEKPEYRSMGYGVTAPIVDTPDRGRSLVHGPLEYWTYNRGEGDTIVHDHVKGKLEGSAKIIAERWVHVAAINAAEGIVHAYRAVYEGAPYVFFVLPEVVVGFESKDAKTFGGTGNDRFASDFPYTQYRFPQGPGHSDTINCRIGEYEIRRWFDRPKDAAKLADEMPIIISMSQTSVESEPRIHIMFL